MASTESEGVSTNDAGLYERQLLKFCTVTANFACKTVLDPFSVERGMPQEQMPNFQASMDRSKAPNVGKAMFCMEVQSKNALAYQRYSEASQNIRKFSKILTQNGETTLQDFPRAHQELGAACQKALKWYNVCFPLHRRFTLVDEPVRLSALCSFRTDGFEIDAKQRYVLVDNSDEIYWTVDVEAESGRCSGQPVRVPSLFFLTNWHRTDAEELQALFAQSTDALKLYFTTLSRPIQTAVQDEELLSELATYGDGRRSGPDKAKQVEAALRSYLNDFGTMLEENTNVLLRTAYESLNYVILTPQPQCVSDACERYFKPPDALMQHASVNRNERLVRLEWKLQIVLDKRTTSVEKTEILPRNVDMALFKQCEQAIERKMAIRTVADPTNGALISLQEAIDRGIIVYRTGSYVNPQTGESMTIPEAIMKEKIIVQDVAIEKSEEHRKSYGVLAVQDYANAKQHDSHYLVHAAIDRKSEERLDFDNAVARGLISLDKLTFYDTLAAVDLPIADALEKGYLKGRKLDNVAELEELRQSQSDIVKARVKKLTTSLSVIEQLKRLTHSKLDEDDSDASDSEL